MNNLKDDYKQNLLDSPLASDYICLARAVAGKKYSREEIAKAFEWVDKTEYTSYDSEELINYLFKLSTNKK